MPAEQQVVTVSEITRQIKSSLEQRFPRVWVQGEVSNFKRHSSGHLYFTLKDEGAQVSATMWRSRASTLTIQPEDGMNVVARGAITVYPPRGNYQIDVDQLKPLGVGELQLAFERLKQRLEKEGLFDQGRKKPIPEFPETIGVVTSPTGAALHDIITVLSRRMPSVNVILAPVRVQGFNAAEEIAGAIRMLNAYGKLDVMIVGRGGGSLEDLWPFNEETVARAIAASAIPVISAVGHEVDVTIADYVADLRAATPSAAAELAVRDRGELLEVLGNLWYTMRQRLNTRVAESRERVRLLAGSYALNRPRDLVREFAQKVDELERTMATGFQHATVLTGRRVTEAHRRLEALSPRAVLKRGYAIVRRDGVLVSSARKLKPGDAATVQFHDGDVETQVRKSS